MKKYNLSEIMKRAWELVKTAGMTISSGLKKAWEEAKSLKEQLISRMEKLIEMDKADGWNYEIGVRDWENYGKNRTYLSIFRARDNSRNNSKFDCGYIDNISGEYVPGKVDLTANFTLSGARF